MRKCWFRVSLFMVAVFTFLQNVAAKVIVTDLNDLDKVDVVPFTCDTDVDIANDGRVYTHLLDGGSHDPVATVNGVVFQRLNNSNISGTSDCSNDSNTYGWVCTSAYSAHGGGNPNGIGVSSDQGIYHLLYSMNYGSNFTKMTLTGLKPGQTYEFRIYQRPWELDRNRKGNFTFSSESHNGNISFTYDSDATASARAEYIRYRYFAPASGEMSFQVSYPSYGATIHYYGFSNEEIEYQKPDKVAIDMSVFGNGSIAPSIEPDGSGLFPTDEEITLSAIANEGNHFRRWRIDGLTDDSILTEEVLTNPDFTYKVDPRVRIVAVFESDAWIFDSVTHVLTDGNWSFTAQLEGGDEKKEITVMKYTVDGGEYLDLNKPITGGYTIRKLNKDLLRSPGYGGPPSLETVILPSTLRQFYDALFAHSGTVKSVIFTDGLPELTQIDGNMIIGCTALKELVFHAENLTSMKDATLANCGSIVSLTIKCPAMSRLANNLMVNCSSLAELTFDTPNTFIAAGSLVNQASLRKLIFTGPMPDKTSVVESLAKMTVAGDYNSVIYRSTRQQGWQNLATRDLTAAEEALASKPTGDEILSVSICEEFANKKIWVVNIASPYDPEIADTIELDADAMIAGFGGSVSILPVKTAYGKDEHVTLTATVGLAHNAVFMGWEGDGTTEISSSSLSNPTIVVPAWVAADITARFQCDWWVENDEVLTDGNWHFKVTVEDKNITILYEERESDDFDGGTYLDLTLPIEGGYAITGLGNHALRGDGYYDINGVRQPYGSKVNPVTMKLPSTITSIGQEAVAWNNNLITLDIDFSKVKSFGYRCVGTLGAIEIQIDEHSFENAEEIARYAFDCDSTLSSYKNQLKLVGPLILPKIKTIGEQAFCGQKKLSTLQIDSPEFSSIGKNAFHITSFSQAVIKSESLVSVPENIFNDSGALDSLLIDCPVFERIEHAGLANIHLSTLSIFTRKKIIVSTDPFTNNHNMKTVVFGGPMPGLNALDLTKKNNVVDYAGMIYFDPRCEGWDEVPIAMPTDAEWDKLPSTLATERVAGNVLGLYTAATQGAKHVWMVKMKSKYAPQGLMIFVR